jgi:dihydroflavonol-4-reductase
MRALVTGGTGFVGSAVVRALLADGASVSCLVRPGSDRRNLAGLPVELIEGDLDCAATPALRSALADCQQVYHVAALYSTRPEDAERLWQVNVEGTRRILEAAWEAGVERMVHTSTIGTIGQRDDGRPPTETDAFQGWATASPYARSKLEAERVALALAEQGAPVVVVNPCAPVGARDIKPSSTGQRILDYLAGRTPSISPGGINFVSVEDVAAGYVLAARRGRIGQRYILGHAQGNLTLPDFLALMARVTGLPAPGDGASLTRRLWRRVRALMRPAPIQPEATGGLRPLALIADPTRAIEELGLPQTPLEDAFAQAVAWFRANHYV